MILILTLARDTHSGFASLYTDISSSSSHVRLHSPSWQNVALNKMTVADSSNNDASAPSNAVDGDTTSVSSRWVSADTPGMHYLAIDLAGNFLISSANIVTDNRGYK